jgi:hypothetical protein
MKVTIAIKVCCLPIYKSYYGTELRRQFNKLSDNSCINPQQEHYASEPIFLLVSEAVFNCICWEETGKCCAVVGLLEARDSVVKCHYPVDARTNTPMH